MNHEVVINTANKAASLRIGNPNSKERVEGPVTDKLRGGSTLFMKGRPALEQREGEDGSKFDLMATISGGDENNKQEIGVVRLEDGSYAVASAGPEGSAELTPLDEFGNKSTSFMLAGSEVNVNFHPLQEDLSVIPGRYGNPGDLYLTFNN